MAVAKHWCFTLNNYTDDEYGCFGTHVASGRLDYVCIGRETGANGTPHLQGHVYRKAKARLQWLKRNVSDRAHWEISKCYAKSIDYCKKGDQPKAEWDELGVSGPSFGLRADVVEFGVPPPAIGERTDLQHATNLLLNGFCMRDIALECPTVYIKFNRGLHALQSVLFDSYESPSCRGIWIFGPPGSGKSHATRNFESDLYIKAQNKWFDGYSDQEAILLDDFDKGGKCLGHYLKIWADRWRCTGEIKGSTVALQHRRFYITSNYTPSEIWTDVGEETLLEAIERRFIICEKTSRSQDIDLLSVSSSLLASNEN